LDETKYAPANKNDVFGISKSYTNVGMDNGDKSKSE
jgi:hypothetical protein